MFEILFNAIAISFLSLLHNLKVTHRLQYFFGINYCFHIVLVLNVILLWWFLSQNWGIHCVCHTISRTSRNRNPWKWRWREPRAGMRILSGSAWAFGTTTDPNLTASPEGHLFIIFWKNLTMIFIPVLGSQGCHSQSLPVSWRSPGGVVSQMQEMPHKFPNFYVLNYFFDWKMFWNALMNWFFPHQFIPDNSCTYKYWSLVWKLVSLLNSEFNNFYLLHCLVHVFKNLWFFTFDLIVAILW